jgi:hypothetical protein
MKPASGAHVSAVDREKAPRTEGMNQRRKHIFANTPTARGSRAAWAGKVGFGLQEERGQRGRLGRRPSGPVSVAVPKVKKKDFWIKNWIFEITKALEICTRKFRRDFDMGILPKFF